MLHVTYLLHYVYYTLYTYKIRDLKKYWKHIELDDHTWIKISFSKCPVIISVEQTIASNNVRGKFEKKIIRSFYRRGDSALRNIWAIDLACVPVINNDL